MPEFKNRTIGRSFRVKEQYLRGLNEEAEREGISLNSLVNKVFKEYTEYQRFSKRFGSIRIFQKSFSHIVEACPEETLREIAKNAGSYAALDFFRTWGMALTYENAVHFMSFVMAEQANWFRCEHHIINDREIFHLRHDMCENWSIYIAEFFSAMLEKHFNKKVETEFLEGSVTLKFPLS